MKKNLLRVSVFALLVVAGLEAAYHFPVYAPGTLIFGVRAPRETAVVSPVPSKPTSGGPTGAAVMASAMASGNLAVSGPFTHDNLAIFLLHGEDRVKTGNVLTLDEALKQGKFRVYETQNVNELSIENLSDAEVFIQAGDIVKGGQQDRTLGYDTLVAAHSGRMRIAAFCVEPGRWGARGDENVRAFSSSESALVGNELKLAARRDKDQGKVWHNVRRTQTALGGNLQGGVEDHRSRSSLQLTLEHSAVREAAQGALDKLLPCLRPEHHDAIGFAVAINGKPASADVYPNADLFRRLWKRQLQASIIEALARKGEGTRTESVTSNEIASFLTRTQEGQAKSFPLANDLCEVQMEANGGVLFETRRSGQVLRQSFVAK